MDTENAGGHPYAGLLVIDKPAGITSRDCVNQVERVLRRLFPKPAKLPKVGHAGTLDPLATGVLVVGVGAGVRLVPYIQDLAKTYEAVFRFGCSTVTGDLEGELIVEADADVPSLESIEHAAQCLTGNISQTPPATSAVRIQGKKAYKYAHQGQAVTVPSRVVRIDGIETQHYQYPNVGMRVQCGSGTYIRTLGMDLAKLCGTTAVMTSLRRTAIGHFALRQSSLLDEITEDSLAQRMLPLADGVVHLPSLHASESDISTLCHGVKIPIGEHDDDVAETLEKKHFSVIDTRGLLRAIVRVDNGFWKPYRVFHHPAG